MPNQPKTPTRPIRIDLDLWDRFGALAEPDRSAVIREFVRWFVREPGAKLPQRPRPESPPWQASA
jgi:hypothetical protein